MKVRLKIPIFDVFPYFFGKFSREKAIISDINLS